jgi:hypothetical protein
MVALFLGATLVNHIFRMCPSCIWCNAEDEVKVREGGQFVVHC